MPFFRYTARGDEGRQIKGLVEAPTVIQAAALLREKGLFVIDVRLHQELISISQIQNKLSRVSFSDVVDFTRQLATMVNAGLPLTEALSILQAQVRNPAMGRVISDILRQVEQGSTIFKAMERYPELFSPTYLSLIRAGEAAGMLDRLLTRLADNLEKSREFRGKVKGALIYPLVIITAMLIVVGVMIVFVVPKLTIIYQDMNIELPWQTQLLIGTSSFSARFFPMLIGIMVLFLFLFFRFRRSNYGRKIIDSIILSLPVFGPLIKTVTLVEFSRTLGMLISAGVPVLDALSIVSTSLGNVNFRQAMVEVAGKVEKGFALSEPVSQLRLFPPIVAQMIKVGESTGKLDEVLLKLSHYFEVEAEQATKGLTTAIEPMIMIVLGVGVGFLVWSVISPIWQLTAAFQ